MREIFSPGLIWFIVGIVILFFEFMMPGFILFFFGVGAVLTAILIWVGLLDSLTAQLIFFSVSSIILLITLRKYLSKYFRGDVSGEGQYEITEGEFIGKRVKVVKRIEPNSVDGRIEFEGTIWNADADKIIEPGTIVEITGKNNITFVVKTISEKEGDAK